MGGRKAYKTDRFVGTSKEVSGAIENLKEFLEKKDTDKISVSAFKIFSESKKPIQYSSYAEKLIPSLFKNYISWSTNDDDNFVRRQISKAWIKVKAKNKISTPKEIDRVVIENGLKFVRGGSND